MVEKQQQNNKRWMNVGSFVLAIFGILSAFFRGLGFVYRFLQGLPGRQNLWKKNFKHIICSN